MMKLTGTDGVELVNPLRIVTVRGWDEDDGNHAMVVCTNRVTVVRETPEEVAEEFRAATAGGADSVKYERALKALAMGACGEGYDDCTGCPSSSSCHVLTARRALGMTGGGA